MKATDILAKFKWPPCAEASLEMMSRIACRGACRVKFNFFLNRQNYSVDRIA